MSRHSDLNRIISGGISAFLSDEELLPFEMGQLGGSLLETQHRLNRGLEPMAPPNPYRTMIVKRRWEHLFDDRGYLFSPSSMRAIHNCEFTETTPSSCSIRADLRADPLSRATDTEVVISIKKVFGRENEVQVVCQCTRCGTAMCIHGYTLLDNIANGAPWSVSESNTGALFDGLDDRERNILREWKSWLSSTPSGTNVARQSQLATDGQLGLFVDPYSAGDMELVVKPVWLKTKAKGGFSSPTTLSLGSAAILPELPPGISEDVIDHLTVLLHGDRDQSLARPAERAFEALVGKIPVFCRSHTGVQLSLGPARPFDFDWKVAENGPVNLLAVVRDAGPGTMVRRWYSGWYIDLDAKQIGRADGDLMLLRNLSRSPTLHVEHAKRLLPRLTTLSKGRLPRPAGVENILELRVPAVPVVHLRVAPVAKTRQRRIQGPALSQVEYMVPMVRYGSHTLDPTDQTAIVMDGEKQVRIVRNHVAELQFLNACETIGLSPLRQVYDARVDPSTLPREGRYLVSGDKGTLRSATDWAELIVSLKAKGWEILIDPGFPCQNILQSPEWLADFEDEGGKWFTVTVGLDVGGRSIPALSLFGKLLGDPRFNMVAAKGEDPAAMWTVPLGEGIFVNESAVKLRRIAAPLLEYLERMSNRHSGDKVRLRKVQVGMLDDSGLVLRGDQALKERMLALCGPRPIMAMPDGIKTPLDHFQEEGVTWLSVRSEAAIGCLIADGVGIGKTAETLVHILAEKNAGKITKPVLIVTPTSVVKHWRDEVEKFTPGMTCMLSRGNDRDRSLAGAHGHDLVVTSYALLLRDIDALKAIDFSLVVFDEVMYLKNDKSKVREAAEQLQADRKLGVGATPLENHLGEVWSIIDLLEPGALGSQRRFNAYFRRPIEKEGNAERMLELRRRLLPFVLRRTMQDVGIELPPVREMTKAIELGQGQRNLYESLRAAREIQVLSQVESKGVSQSYIHILAAITMLRQVCDDPRLVNLSAAAAVKESAKLEELMNMLHELRAEGRRTVVVSQFTGMLDLIGERLKVEGFGFRKLVGKMDQFKRDAELEAFAKENIPVFMLSLGAGGYGIQELVAADTLIFYDGWWNPKREEQGAGRVARRGQTKPVMIYRMVCTGTVEERIEALKQEKAGLADGLFGGAFSNSIGLTEDLVRNLFMPIGDPASA